MQYTSNYKMALLAVALFGTSAIAVPFASDDTEYYEVEAREVDNNELAAREFYYDMYLEARASADPSLDVRDMIESLDFEARDSSYLSYLSNINSESRAAAAVSAQSSLVQMGPAPPPPVILSSSPKSSRVKTTTKHSHDGNHEISHHSASESKHERVVHSTPHQKSVRRRAKKLAAREFYYDMYDLEARADPSLDARDIIESLDFEAREYLD